jgi:hypothetical protein
LGGHGRADVGRFTASGKPPSTTDADAFPLALELALAPCSSSPYCGDDMTSFPGASFGPDFPFDDSLWMWKLLEHYLTLTVEEQWPFWNHFMFASTSDGEILHPLLRAQFLQTVWNHGRCWERDADEAGRLMIVVFELSDEMSSLEDRRLFKLFTASCPYLDELIDRDEYWTDFELPAERK